MYTDAVNTLLPIKANVQPASMVDRGGSRLSKDHGSLNNRLKFLGYGPDGTNNRYDPSGRRLGERIRAGRTVDIFI
ncbi:hypothetical protein ACFL9T_13230 [Thermodesulfobacteriota bacterium]